jgi:hypothetical protein
VLITILSKCRKLIKWLQRKVQNIGIRLEQELQTSQDQARDVAVSVPYQNGTKNIACTTNCSSAAQIVSSGTMPSRSAAGRAIYTQKNGHMIDALKQRARKREIVEEAVEALQYLGKDLNASLWAQLMKLWGLKISASWWMSSVERSAENPQTFLGELLTNHLRANPFLRGFGVRSKPVPILSPPLHFYINCTELMQPSHSKVTST